MPRLLTMTAAQVLGVWAIGVSVSLAQEPAARNEPAPRAEQRGAPAAREAAPKQAVNPAMMDWLLKEWEKQSRLLKSLDVAILRIDDSPAWGDKDYYQGRALFKAPNLAFIDFNKIEQDAEKQPIKDPKDPTGKKYLTTPFERIICTGAEVWQYRSDVQQVTIFPLGKDEQQKAIEEGPLPFLFNMRADDARKRYQMTLMSRDDKSYGVSIKPKLQVDKDSFSLAFVNLDKKFLLPIRIVMKSPDGKSTKDFRLGPMTPNAKINDKNFEGRPLGPPWKVIRNPVGADRPRGGNLRGRGDGPPDPAAARLAPGQGTQRR
jgi:TIGR03009 family protein